MRAILHFLVTMIGAVAWTFAMCFFVLVWALAWLAKRIDPNMVRGNCWLYALPLFIEKGGYLAVRAADGNRFLKVFMVPHVLYMPILHSRSVISQYVPVDRRSSSLLPWYAIDYRGEIRSVESNHNAPDDLQ